MKRLANFPEIAGAVIFALVLIFFFVGCEFEDETNGPPPAGLPPGGGDFWVTLRSVIAKNPEEATEENPDPSPGWVPPTEEQLQTWLNGCYTLKNNITITVTPTGGGTPKIKSGEDLSVDLHHSEYSGDEVACEFEVDIENIQTGNYTVTTEVSNTATSRPGAIVMSPAPIPEQIQQGLPWQTECEATIVEFQREGVSPFPVDAWVHFRHDATVTPTGHEGCCTQVLNPAAPSFSPEFPPDC